MLPVVTYAMNEKVTIETATMAVLPTLPPVTCENDEYEERAAIKEFDAGMPRDKAESEALLEIKRAKWLQNRGLVHYE
jgi:hypothetical protein